MKIVLLFLFCLTVQLGSAQRTDVKHHRPWPYIGNAKLLSSWGETGGSYSDKIFEIDVPQSGWYQLKFRATLFGGEKLELFLNGLSNGTGFTGNGVGWESFAENIWLNQGLNRICLRNNNFMVPLAENPELEFINKSKTKPAFGQNHSSAVNTVTLPATPVTGRVLPNPAGNYLHDIETEFRYTTCAWVYLKSGYRYKFTTNTTINADPVLHLFHPGNIATMSWMNDNGSTGTKESRIDVTPTLDGFYLLMIRGTKSITPGTQAHTDIFCNNIMLVEKAVIGGTILKSAIGATTDKLNFFTCRFSNAKADTRMMLINGQNLTASFYNDDYSNLGGDWNWGFSSRINSVWPSGTKPYLTFVCAYSPFSEGLTDTYMGNRNSVAWTFFTNWKEDDCVQAGVGYPLNPNPYYYNCIGWSGGFTNAFYWPGGNFSTWTVYGNDLASFDNYYGNNPARYPGAYTYTRTGATWSNAIIDLWATTNGGTGLYYTHGSVQKPGNNHPHGYDWESKPGSVERSFHPRLGPAGETGANYGTPVNHYIHTGGFARTANATDAIGAADEAVQAGLAVYDNPQLSEKAQSRLAEWIGRMNTERKTAFDQLYKNWKATWAANAVQSNPAAYCRNAEYKKLEQWCREHKEDALPLLCSNYVQGDYLAETPLCTVSIERYKHLLEEVKTEYKNNLYNREGKFRIRSDYGNGICFIEKILSVSVPAPVAATVSPVQVVIAPNPVQDWFTVNLNITEPARVSLKVISTKTRISKIVLSGKELAAGNYQYTISTTGFAGGNGDIITVLVNINGQLNTFKVLVTK